MGNYLDYSTPALPDLGEGISKIGDALTVMLDRKRQERQFEETKAFQREQETRKFNAEQDQQKYLNRQADEKALRDKATFAQQNAEFERKAGADIQQHLADTDVQGATAIAARTPHFNPETGKVEYGKLIPGQGPAVRPEPVQQPAEARPPDAVDPAAAAMARGRAVPPEAPMQGPPLTPEGVLGATAADTFGAAPPEIMARRKALEAQRAREVADREKAVGDQATFDATREEHNQARANDLASYPERQAETRRVQREFAASQQAVPADHDKWLREKALAQDQTPYTLQFGNEAPVQMDVQTQRYKAHTRAADDFLAGLPSNLSEADRRAAQNAHAAILSGMPVKEAESQFLKERMGISGQEFKGEQNQLERENKLRIAQIPKPGITVQTQGLEDKEREWKVKNTERVLDKAFKDAGLEKAGEQLNQIQDVERKLQGNARDQQTAMLELMRAGIGKSNRLNQYIEKKYGANLGVGSADALANRLQQMWDGGLGDQARSIALDTAAELRREMQDRIKSTAAKAHKSAGDMRYFDPAYAENYLEVTIPGYSAQPAEAPPPEIGARRRGKTVRMTGGSPTDAQVDTALKVFGGAK